MTGRLIVFEGADGVGKTGQINLIKKFYQEMMPNHSVVFTKAPGGGVHGAKIRQLILDQKEPLPYPLDALTFTTSLISTIVDDIVPALRQGKTVFCDRLLDSLLVYQGYARQDPNLPAGELNWPAYFQVRNMLLRALEMLPAHDLMLFFNAMMVLYLDAPAQVIETRLQARADKNVMDGFKTERLLDGYHTLMYQGRSGRYIINNVGMDPIPYHVISASGSKTEVHDLIKKILHPSSYFPEMTIQLC